MNGYHYTQHGYKITSESELSDSESMADGGMYFTFLL